MSGKKRAGKDQEVRRKVGIGVIVILVALSGGLCWLANITNQNSIPSFVFSPVPTLPNILATLTATPFMMPITPLVLNDLLNGQGTDTNEWNDHTYSDGGCQFLGGAYQASGTQPGARHYCIANASKDDYSNFIYQIQMRIIEGNCGGLLFRMANSSDNYYTVEVCRDGTYAMLVYLNDKPTILQHRESSAINTGANQNNVLKVIANGSSLTLYINNQTVVNVSDSTYRHGHIGVFAHAYNNFPTEVAYSNAKVWLI